MTLTCQTKKTQMTDPPSEPSFDDPPSSELSFAQIVEKGWESECEVSVNARVSTTGLGDAAFDQVQQSDN